MPNKCGHHRKDLRIGPWESFQRRKARYLALFARPGVLMRRWVTDGRLPPDMALAAKTVLAEWEPLANDETGEAWE